MTEIRAELHMHDHEGNPTAEVLGEIVVTDEPRLVIRVPAGVIFSAPLDLLAWQMCLMEPRLGQFFVEPARARADDDAG